MPEPYTGIPAAPGFTAAAGVAAANQNKHDNEVTLTRATNKEELAAAAALGALTRV